MSRARRAPARGSGRRSLLALHDSRLFVPEPPSRPTRVPAMRSGEAARLGRSSGVLLHVTSLPGGRLGPEAYEFVDWLAEAGQSWWQVLPLGPPDPFGSPYTSASAFAAWRELLGEPEAEVTPGELEHFVARHAYW